MMVIDASAVVDLLIERGANAAVATEVRKHQPLWAPELILVEVPSALWRLVRMGQLSESDANRAMCLLRRMPVTLVGHRHLMTDAWSSRQTLRISDAYYVSCARRLGMPLLTTDDRMARATHKDVDIRLVT